MGTYQPPPGFRTPAATPVAAAVHDDPPARGGCLTIVLGLNILGAGVLVWAWIAAPDVFKFLDRSSSTFTFTMVLGILNGVFSVAIWKWQRWGFWGFLGTSVFLALVQMQNGGQRSLMGGLVGPALVWWLLQKHWEQMPYRREPGARRMSPLFWGPAVALLLVLLGVQAWKLRAVTHVGFDPTRNAAADVFTALEEGSANGKRVIVLVGGDWCPGCRSLEEKLTKDDEIARFLEARFVLVRVYTGPANDNAAFLAKYPPFDTVPHLVVLSRGGDCVASVGSERFGGANGLDRAKIVAFLKGWAL